MIHLFPPDPEFPSSSSTTTTSTPPPDPRALRRGRHMAFQVKSVEDTERKLRMAGTVYTKFGIPGSAAVQVRKSVCGLRWEMGWVADCFVSLAGRCFSGTRKDVESKSGITFRSTRPSCKRQIDVVF